MTDPSLTADALLVQADAEMQAWIRKWPSHCPNCSGWGAVVRRRRGKAQESMACEDLPLSQCHRCGAHGLSPVGSGPCNACGWNFDDGLPYTNFL